MSAPNGAVTARPRAVPNIAAPPARRRHHKLLIFHRLTVAGVVLDALPLAAAARLAKKVAALIAQISFRRRARYHWKIELPVGSIRIVLLN